MFVKRLTIEHFGRFGYKSVNFCDTLNVIAGEDTRAVFAALNVALCNRLLRLQVSPYCISEKKPYLRGDRSERNTLYFRNNVLRGFG